MGNDIAPKMTELTRLDYNEGQIPDVKPNPREIMADEITLLKDRIREYPEMLEYRAIMAYPYEGRLVVIGGNMRLRALREMGYEETPVFILHEDTTADQLNAYQILDNVPFGKWDYKKLTENWNADQLKGMAVTVPVPQSSLNLGDFFSEEDEQGKTKIIVQLSTSLQPMKDEIKDTIKTELQNNNYLGCKVK